MSKSNLVNGTPPCQNIMFPNPFHFFSPSSSSPHPHPYQYQPLIHVPTKQNSVTLGEIGASVNMLSAQVLELSKRMESMESKFSHFEKMVSDDIFLLKNTLSENSAELLNVRSVAENARDNFNKINESIVQQNYCIDEMADAVSRTIHLSRKQIQVQKQSSFKSNVANAQLGIIRRRLSKFEDFTSEFYEQFESFKNIKDIFSSLSDHIDECDRDISSFVMQKDNNFEFQSNDNDNNVNDNLENLETYFSNYEEYANDNNNGSKELEDDDDDDFEKLL